MKPGDIVTVREDSDGDEASLPTKVGHFEIVGRLGAGGMGLVFEGRDTVLDRKVALKLLHPAAGGATAPARLLREAQALAKLSHPNVVTVFEVGTVGSDQFIAMELVEGVTLLAWMQTPHTWREVLDIFIAVGGGLAAVHALGLVHRDFKPSNVLVDTRGVPKLGDFGLVGAIDDPDAPAPSISSDHALTTPGSVMGTPAYMAPEQKRGEPVDARADQFSFAKSLREALGEQLPKALLPILDRAQAEEPDDRYPDMAALLADLARVRRGRARIYLAAGGAAVVAIAIVIAWSFGRSTAPLEDPCVRPTARIDGVWSTTRSTALESHLAKIDPAFGTQRFALARPVLDAGATRWQDLHVEACQQTRDGRQSDAMLDRRMSCLDRALFELDETVKTLETTTDGKTLDAAILAASRLPTLDACADTAALAERVPLPTNPSKRAEVEALARELIDIDVELRAAGTRTAGDRAVKAVAKARTLDHAESLAGALRVLAASHHANELYATEVTALREAVVAAAAAHDDRMLAELWSRVLEAHVHGHTARDAETLLPAAEAANARVTAPLELRAGFTVAKAKLLGVMHDVPKARMLIDPLIAEATSAKAASLVLALRDTHSDLAEMAQESETQEKETRALIPDFEARYGKDHPSVGEIRRKHAVALFQLRRFPEAEVELREAIRIGEARLAPSPALARLLYSAGAALLGMEKEAEGRPYMERALAMAKATMPPEDWRIATYIMGLAAAASDDAAAKRGFTEALAILERGPRPNMDVANVLHNLATLEQDVNKFDAAIALYERSIKEYEAMRLGSPMPIAMNLARIAECQYAAKRYAAAVETSERAIEGIDHPVVLAQVHYTHGMARVKAGDAGGKTELAEAVAALKKAGAPVPSLN